MRRRATLSIAALLVLSATTASLAGARATLVTDTHGDIRGATAPPDDPERDVLGWENGYWYNESIDVNMSDGLDRAELDAILARTMARVEEIRRLEYQKTPPVNFLSREEYADAIAESFANRNITTADRLHQNAKFEALFLVDESTDFYDVHRQNQQGFAAAFYTTRGFPAANVSAGEIAIVRGSGGEIRLTETTLAHELVHALQDQHFNLSSLPYGNTEDAVRATNGVVEGDATYTQSLYNDRCSASWEGTCLTAQRSGSSDPANVGLVLYRLVAYGNGMTFVEHVRQEGGWEAVNALYDDLPETTEQIIHPEKYPGDAPTNLSIRDRSDARWRPLELEGGIDHATFGEAGLFVMLWYPGYREGGRNVIIPYNTVFVGREIQPYDFDHAYSAGWDGDRFLPFVTDESNATNEMGYVWKIAWDSREDAEEFRDAYVELLKYYGAERVDERTYWIEDSPPGTVFGDAFYVALNGTTMRIVNAPTVGELSGVDTSIQVDTPTPGSTPSPTRTPTEPTTPTETPTEVVTSTVTPTDVGRTSGGETSESGSSPTPSRTPTGATATATPGQPGVGPAGVLMALAILVLALARRS